MSSKSMKFNLKIWRQSGPNASGKLVDYVVEDVITTGGSTREVVEVVEAAGAVALAAGSIVDRSAGRADVGVPRVALWELAVESFPPEFCPLCDTGVPVVKPGSRPGSGA